jgi:hypothetical protein
VTIVLEVDILVRSWFVDCKIECTNLPFNCQLHRNWDTFLILKLICYILQVEIAVLIASWTVNSALKIVALRSKCKDVVLICLNREDSEREKLAGLEEP